MGGRRWSVEELQILKDNLPRLGFEEFIAAGLLERTQRAIEHKAKQLELKSHCVDCGGVIGAQLMRCGSCSSKAKWARGDYNGRDSEEYRLKLSEAARAAWGRGDMEGNSGKLKAAHSRGAYRNNPEKLKAAHARGDFSEECRCKISEGVKAAWARGDFAGLSEKVKAAWARGAFDSAFDEECRRKHSESAKAAFARGDYAGVFQSPTRPERAVMAVLEFMGIGYEFNKFRLQAFTYDFYLPGRNILVEYDGKYWHSLPDVIRRDKIKDALAVEAGYRLIRLRGLEGHDLTGAEIWGQLSKELGVRDAIL